MKSIYKKIYEWSSTNSQESVDSIVHKRGQWKKEIYYLKAKQQTGEDLWKPDFFFFHKAIEISMKKFQVSLQLDFSTLWEKVSGRKKRQERTSLIFNLCKSCQWKGLWIHSNYNLLNVKQIHLFRLLS